MENNNDKNKFLLKLEMRFSRGADQPIITCTPHDYRHVHRRLLQPAIDTLTVILKITLGG